MIVEIKLVVLDFCDGWRGLETNREHAFLEYLYSLIRGKIEYLAEAEELHQLLTGDIDYKGRSEERRVGKEC